MAIAVVLATLVVSGTALAEDPDEEEDDPAPLDWGEEATDTLSTGTPIYCRLYGWPPTLHCVI